MKTILKFLSIALLAITLSNCKKDKTPVQEPIPAPTSPVAGSLSLMFEGMVGSSPLVFATDTYTNQAGNTFNVSMVKFYISNVKLTKMDNSIFTESNSYHLIDLSDDASTSFTIPGVPLGDYKSIEFMIGVDSTRNVSGAQTGALDPAKGMFWSWSSGYIMAKVEGTSPQSTAPANKLEFHIGGFSGSNKTLKTVSPSFNTDTAHVTTSITPQIHLSANIAEWFAAPNIINFSSTNSVTMPSPTAKKIADNYADMFTIEHIHN